MALGKRGSVQGEFWVSAEKLPRSPGHPFYKKLNQLLAEGGFDDWVEERCAEFYAGDKGRPGIPPGVYFRMLFVGYFEGITSQRGIAWRSSDSLSLRSFLGLAADQDSPDHSSLTRVRKRLPLEVHEEVFEFVLHVASKKKLLKGKTVAVDATTLEANAAMKSIVRKDSGEDYTAYLRGLAEEEGLEEPTDEDLRRFDKNRKGKSTSNKDWRSKTDPDSRIARMKDGRTHLAYKAKTLADLEALGVRTYVPEPVRKGRRRWKGKPAAHKDAVYANRRRLRGERSRRLQRKRSELAERSFAHMCETGDARRTWLRGLAAMTKRYVIHGAARNLGVILRKLFGIGTPRGLQSGLGGPIDQLLAGWRTYIAMRTRVIVRMTSGSLSIDISPPTASAA